MFDFKKGYKETYYEVAAYDKPEQLFTTIKQFEKKIDAEIFCKQYDYEYICLYHDVPIKCKLIIIKVDSEIL